MVQAHGLHQTLALFLALAAGFVLRAQPPEPPGATFSANADLVLLNATVRTRKGGFVPGLGKTDFQVLEDGVPQTIRIFQRHKVNYLYIFELSPQYRLTYIKLFKVTNNQPTLFIYSSIAYM